MSIPKGAGTINYRFYQVERCKMCFSDPRHFKILGKRLNKSQGFSPHRLTGISVTICQCRKCGLIFPNPTPVPNSIRDHYEVEPGEYWDDKYFSLSYDYFSSEIRWLKKLLEFKPGIKVLDIGAGIGKTMSALGRAGFDVTGLEPSSTFRQMAIERLKIDERRILLSSIEETDFAGSSFDFITFSAVLEHLYDPASALKKASGWLTKNGIIHAEVPSSDWLISKMINAQYKLRGLDYVSNLSPMHPPFHLYEFTLRSFLANSRFSGYQVADHGYYVCKTYMPRILDFLIKPYMKWSNKGMQLVVWLKKT